MLENVEFLFEFVTLWWGFLYIVYTQIKVAKNISIAQTVVIKWTFIPGLASTIFWAIPPFYNKLTWHEPTIQSKISIWPAINFKKNTWPQWAVNLNPRYGHVILVSRHIVLTGVNTPFYSCPFSDLAFAWQRGWSWPCFDTDLTAFVM